MAMAMFKLQMPRAGTVSVRPDAVAAVIDDGNGGTRILVGGQWVAVAATPGDVESALASADDWTDAVRAAASILRERAEARRKRGAAVLDGWSTG